MSSSENRFSELPLVLIRTICSGILFLRCLSKMFADAVHLLWFTRVTMQKFHGKSKENGWGHFCKFLIPENLSLHEQYPFRIFLFVRRTPKLSLNSFDSRIEESPTPGIVPLFLIRSAHKNAGRNSLVNIAPLFDSGRRQIRLPT